MSTTRCASCGSGAEADAKFCWLCGYPLSQSGALAPPAERVAAPPVDGLVWLMGFVLALLVMLGVAVELALLWPGLLIPYAVVLVPVVAVLGRIVYVQRLDFWKGGPATASAAPAGGSIDTRNRGDGGGGGSPLLESDTVGEVVTALAIGMAAVIGVIGLLVLMAVAAFVILLAICLGIIASSGV